MKMDFGKALEALKAGKNVRQSTWNINYYIIYDNVHDKNEYPFGSFDGITTYKDGTYSRNLFEFTPEHLIAEDWEIVEDIPEVKLHVKEYFTCPKCGHVNIDINIENTFPTCRECGIKVKILSDSVDYHMILETYKQLLEKITNDIELEIMVSSRNQKPSNWQFNHSLSAFRQCFKMLTQLEVETLKQQCKDTNQH